MVKIKICGIRSWEEARMIIDAGIDNLGFVFAPGLRQIKPEAAREIIDKLPPFTTTVGVFVNEPRYSLMEIASFCRLDILQLNGEETPEYCHGLSQKIIKTFKVKDKSFLAEMKKYEEVKGYLLDAFLPGHSGDTGEAFNWALAKTAVDGGQAIILAGGLTPENVGSAVRTVKPYAVDVANGVETKGQKDPVKIAAFIQAVNNAVSS